MKEVEVKKEIKETIQGIEEEIRHLEMADSKDPVIRGLITQYKEIKNYWERRYKNEV